MVLASSPRVDRLLLPFPRSLGVIAKPIDADLVPWAMRKYKRLRGHKKSVRGGLTARRRHDRTLFPHWALAGTNTVGTMGAGSREVHAGFCEKLRVRFPRLTHLYNLFILESTRELRTRNGQVTHRPRGQTFCDSEAAAKPFSRDLPLG